MACKGIEMREYNALWSKQEWNSGCCLLKFQRNNYMLCIFCLQTMRVVAFFCAKSTTHRNMTSSCSFQQFAHIHLTAWKNISIKQNSMETSCMEWVYKKMCVLFKWLHQMDQFDGVCLCFSIRMCIEVDVTVRH